MSGILEVGFYMDRKAIWNISLSTDFNLLSLGSAASKIVSRKFSSMGITQNDWSGKEPLEVPGRDSLLNCIWEHCKVVITRQSIWRQMKKLCVKKYSAALCCDTGNSNILYKEMSTTYEFEWRYHKEKNPTQFSLSNAVLWEPAET